MDVDAFGALEVRPRVNHLANTVSTYISTAWNGFKPENNQGQQFKIYICLHSKGRKTKNKKQTTCVPARDRILLSSVGFDLFVDTSSSFASRSGWVPPATLTFSSFSGVITS